jgi:hypothetical protein
MFVNEVERDLLLGGEVDVFEGGAPPVVDVGC